MTDNSRQTDQKLIFDLYADGSETFEFTNVIRFGRFAVGSFIVKYDGQIPEFDDSVSDDAVDYALIDFINPNDPEYLFLTGPEFSQLTTAYANWKIGNLDLAIANFELAADNRSVIAVSTFDIDFGVLTYRIDNLTTESFADLFNALITYRKSRGLID